jgi:hypothetical protein
MAGDERVSIVHRGRGRRRKLIRFGTLFGVSDSHTFWFGIERRAARADQTPRNRQNERLESRASAGVSIALLANSVMQGPALWLRCLARRIKGFPCEFEIPIDIEHLVKAH